MPKSELTLPWQGSTVQFVPSFFSPISFLSLSNSTEKVLPEIWAQKHFRPSFPMNSAPEETPTDLCRTVFSVY